MSVLDSHFAIDHLAFFFRFDLKGIPLSLLCQTMPRRRTLKISPRYAHAIIVGLIVLIGLGYWAIHRIALNTVATLSTHAEDIAYGSHQVLLMQAKGKECHVWPVRFNELVAQHQADRAHIDALIDEGHAAGC